MPPKGKEKAEKATKQIVRVHENRKKKHQESEGNGERWLLTYADMITLLMALFIILFAISKPPSKIVYDRLAKEMQGGFGGTSAITLPVHGRQRSMTTSNTPDKDQAQSLQSAASTAATPSKTTTVFAAQKANEAKNEAKMKKLMKELKEAVKKVKMEKRVVVTKTGRGVVISLLTDHTSFESGSAVLHPGAADLLRAIGPFLQRINNEVRVEGNTDNIPIATAEYPTNWELSAARAVTVTRYLVEHVHLEPQRLSAAGYGQFKPQADNLTEAHRQLNRRVDIVILNTRLAKETEESPTNDGTVTGRN